MKKFILVLLLPFLFTSCTDAPNAQRILSENGYKNIEITGYDWFGCGKDDDLSTGFNATSPSGHYVKGVVCSSLFPAFGKGSTIRLK